MVVDEDFILAPARRRPEAPHGETIALGHYLLLLIGQMKKYGVTSGDIIDDRSPYQANVNIIARCDLCRRGFITMEFNQCRLPEVRAERVGYGRQLSLF